MHADLVFPAGSCERITELPRSSIMETFMRATCLVPVAILAWSCVGCDSETSPSATPGPPSPARKARAVSGPPSSGPQSPARPFLDQKKSVPPHLEWTREVTSRNGGAISFRVESQGPFAITVVTDRALKAMKSGDRNPIDKSEILLTADSNGPSHEGKLTLPAGSSWFILENRADKPVEFHIECSPAG